MSLQLTPATGPIASRITTGSPTTEAVRQLCSVLPVHAVYRFRQAGQPLKPRPAPSNPPWLWSSISEHKRSFKFALTADYCALGELSKHAAAWLMNIRHHTRSLGVLALLKSSAPVTSEATPTASTGALYIEHRVRGLLQDPWSHHEAASQIFAIFHSAPWACYVVYRVQ